MGLDALFAAAIAGDADATNMLEKEADRVDFFVGWTILHSESEKGKAEHVRFILREFATKNLLVKLSIYEETALHFAAENGHTEVAEVLIDAARSTLLSSSATTHNSVTSFQAFLRQADRNSDTALHKAVAGGWEDIVKLLVEADPSDQHVQNNQGKTPIYIAAEIGYMEIVKLICSTCAAPSLDGPRGSTALHATIKNGYHSTAVVEVLIEAVRLLPSFSFQTFVRKGDEDLNTALHKAVIEGNLAIVKLLSEADPSGQHSQNRKGETPIYIAAEKGYTEIVKVLCTTCTAPSFDGPGGSTFSFQAFLRKGDEDLNTALHKAVMQGNLAVVKLLLEADSTGSPIQNKKGETPIYIAAEKGYTEIVKLICATCDPSDQHAQNNEGKTPIYIAAEKGYTEIVKVLCTTCTTLSDLTTGRLGTALHAASKNLDGGIEVFDVLIAAARLLPSFSSYSFQDFLGQGDDDSNTAIHIAVMKGYVALVKLFLEADPSYRHHRNNDGKTPMYIAAEKGYNEIVKVICTTCTDPSLDGPGGSTALHAAILNINEESVLSMVGNSVHNVVLFNDNLGWTLVHHAAYHQFDSVLGALVEAQCQWGYPFDEGYMVSTPFHVAAEKGYTSTVILLLKIWPYQSSAYIAVNKEGQNILHLAALQSKKKMIKGILEYCPQKYLKEMVNKKDKYGNTPFHLLIRQGCFVPEFIMYKDLDMMAKNLEEWTPLDNFYIEAEIIAEQAQIRIALDNIQTDRYWTFWRKNIKREWNYMDSVVVPSDREAKDAKFENARKKLIEEKRGRMKKDLERYKKRTNTQIIVTALITTVTFTVGFTMPGGLYQSGVADQGLVIFSKKIAFNAFMVSDALALLLSTCSLFLYFLESMHEDPRQVSRLNAASTGLNIVSVVAMMLTFITGTYVVLSHSQALALSVCLIGSFFFLFVIVLLIKMVYDRQVERKEEQV